MFDIQQMTNAELSFWVSRFILEVQKKFRRATSKYIVSDNMWASNVHTRDKTVFFHSESSSINRTLNLEMKDLISPTYEGS